MGTVTNRGRSPEFLECMKDLMSNWPIADEDRAGKIIKLFGEVWDDYGAAMFKTCCKSIIHEREGAFFPTVAEFKVYMPHTADKRWEPGVSETQRRRMYPEEFFGQTDVMSMMKIVQARITRNSPRMTNAEVEDVIDQVLERRRQATA